MKSYIFAFVSEYLSNCSSTNTKYKFSHLGIDLYFESFEQKDLCAPYFSALLDNLNSHSPSALCNLIKLQNSNILYEYINIVYKINSERKKMRLTKRELANMFNIGSGTIDNIENLRNIPSFFTILSICKFFKINIEFL